MKFLGPPSSGSTAGTTFSHNRAGQYTRNRRTPVIGTRTPRQAVVKANMTIASQSWQGLSPSQQAAWISYASGHPIVDALGQSIKLTGAQYYIKCNAALLNANQPQTSVPPATGIITPEVVGGWTVSADGLAFVFRSGGMSPQNIALAVSKLTSAGVNFNQTFHQVFTTAPQFMFYDISAEALAWAGTFVLGKKLWLRDTPVSSEGLTGSPVVVQATITATQVLVAPVLTSTVATDVTATWSGGTATQGIHYQQGPSATGPWTDFDEIYPATSPNTDTGFTTGLYVRAVLFDIATGVASGWSNSIHVM